MEYYDYTLMTEEYKANNKPFLWSILIPTLFSRIDKFDALIKEFYRQIAELETYDVSLEWEPDYGEKTIGEKRNILLERACPLSDYVSFFDDDDFPHQVYIKRVLEDITKQKPDMVATRLAYYHCEEGKTPILVRHEMLNAHRVSHLNPIKSTIASKFKFKHIDSGEDVEWCNRVRPHIGTQSYCHNAVYNYYHYPVKPEYEKQFIADARKFKEEEDVMKELAQH